MEIKKILIIGDSFSSLQLAGTSGWPALLMNYYDINNISSPGIGEYKILQKLKSQNLKLYDLIILCHTSPYRVHCEENPLYDNNHMYRKSDILFADAESKKTPIALSLCQYFNLVFDLDYYTFVHTKCCEDIAELTKDIPVIHLTNFKWDELYKFNDLINFYKFWQKNKGPYCHYNSEGSLQIANILLDKIKLIEYNHET